MTTFRPTVYDNQRPLLTPADLDNHPKAADYIHYISLVRYPVDFPSWLKRQENEIKSLRAKEAMLIATMQADPYCRSAVKVRVHRRAAPGRYRK